MKKYRQKNFNKVTKGKKMPNPVFRFQNLAARFEQSKSNGKKK